MRISDWSSDVCSSDLGHPPAAAPAVKDMRADDIGHHQALAPARPDRLRVIMRCQPDLGKDISAERGRGDAARAQPVPAFGRARPPAIAAEGELTHPRAPRSLKNDAATGGERKRVV